MFIRHAFVGSVLAVFGYVGTAYANSNSCGNVNTFSSYDESGLHESDYGIYAVGTFRIPGEGDENKQPMFNLNKIDCTKQYDDRGAASLECKVTSAVVWPTEDKPNSDDPNCSLDLDSSEYAMKELQKGVLVGMDDSTSCWNTTLTIDRNTKRVYLSFTRSKYADNFDRIRPGTCGVALRTQVLMNCTGWPKIRNKGRTPPRYCDFSSSSDK